MPDNNMISNEFILNCKSTGNARQKMIISVCRKGRKRKRVLWRPRR